MLKLKQIAVILAFIAVGAGVIAGVVTVSSTYLDDKSATVKTQCTTGQTHQVAIRDDEVAPSHLAAPLCDKLTITNLDKKERFVAFGPHEYHVPYDGVEGKDLLKGQGFTVTLVQTGTFTFHDHFEDAVRGSFTVVQR